jgi:UDP-2-acetamido-2,6-beta-L-arabino-hexul-4-ose reductase
MNSNSESGTQNSKQIRIGITGQPGFIGTHLYNYLGLKNDIFKRIPFEDDFFEDEKLLNSFVSSCDVICHLAAMNRHNDPEVIYATNVGLVKKLIMALESTNSKPHVLFSSSTQEESENLYGKSKRDGRNLFAAWAEKNDTRFTGLVIPNVFGPFGNPYYNSVVATFCHQLTHNEIPHIEVDGNMKLIYVNELVKVITDRIFTESDQKIVKYEIPHHYELKVSAILNILKDFKTGYFNNGVIPDIRSQLWLSLFTTFRCYMPHDKFPVPYKLNTDNRGSFVELIKANTSGQTSYSITIPGITRGNHYHTRKVERFAVIKGNARIRLRKTGTPEIIEYFLDGKHPSFVDMPIWYTHNITNIGDEELFTMFWINEPYDPADPDTYFEEV